MSALSFAADIGPLFRPSDIEEMKSNGIDLSSYEEVKRQAQDIHGRLAAQDMPCDQPWSAADIDKFKHWMDSGMNP